MAFAPRQYQLELVDRVAEIFRRGVPSALMQLGTGGGKTATAAWLLGRAVNRGYTTLFLAHLDALIEDTAERLAQAGIHAGFVQAGRPTDPTAPVQVASLQTLHARGERPPAKIVVLDEAHRAMSASVRGILEAYPDAALLGLTATPQRGDRQPLGDVFKEMVCGPSNRWLTEHGYLVPCELVWPGNFEKRGLSMHPVKAYAMYGGGRRALVFAANKAHGAQLAEEFSAAGYSSDVMFGDTPRARRRELRARLAAGDLQVLVGVDVFIEGFDCPEVEVILLARAFIVTGAFLQAIGRGLRPSPATGKTHCTVIDLRGAVVKHGLPDEDRVWSLSGKAVRRAETLTALQRCKECLAVFRPAKVCPRCGEPTKGAPKIPRVLTRVEKLDKLSALPQADRDAHYFASLFNVASRRIGLSDERATRWATFQFKKRFGREPGGRAA